MKFIIDNADIKKIQAIYDVFPVDGVTTNPTILAESGRQPFEVLKGIRAWIGAEAELHVQAVSRSTEGMIEDGHRIVKELGEGVLLSHNPKYEPRPMTEDIRCQGRVLGVCDESYLE